MKRSTSFLLASFCLTPLATAQIDIGGFDLSRGRGLSSTGTLGYDTLRAALTAPSFAATAGCTATIAPETPVATAAYLADKEFFFVGDGGGALSAAEGADIAAYHAAGGHLILVADSGGGGIAGSVLLALGSSASYAASGCPNANTGGVISAASNPITNGPFGNVAGGSYSTTITTGIALGSATALVTCTDGTINYAAHPPGTLNGASSGGVYFMGDPDWFDLFTVPGGTFYNANNLTVALNTFASRCGGGNPITIACDPANANSNGGPVELNGSSLGAPGANFSGLHVEANGGPAGEFGYLLVSCDITEPGTPISNGILCLRPPTGRYAPAAGPALNSVGSFNSARRWETPPGSGVTGWDVPIVLPTPPGGQIGPGTTKYFQLWYRDGQRSNFSNAICVTF